MPPSNRCSNYGLSRHPYTYLILHIQKEYLAVAEVKFMEAQCLISAGESGTAIAALEAIDVLDRTTVMNITLGRVYETHGLKR